MEERFGMIPLTNSSMLCVGGITRREAERAQEDGVPVDGFGYYLFVATKADPRKPIEILAKLASLGAAEKLARLFGSEDAPAQG